MPYPQYADRRQPDTVVTTKPLSSSGFLRVGLDGYALAKGSVRRIPLDFARGVGPT